MMYQRKRGEAEARRGSGAPAGSGPLTAGPVAGRLWMRRTASLQILVEALSEGRAGGSS